MMVIKLVMELGSETRSKSKACAFPFITPPPSPGEGRLSEPETVSLAYRNTSRLWAAVRNWERGSLRRGRRLIVVCL